MKVIKDDFRVIAAKCEFDCDDSHRQLGEHSGSLFDARSRLLCLQKALLGWEHEILMGYIWMRVTTWFVAHPLYQGTHDQSKTDCHQSACLGCVHGTLLADRRPQVVLCQAGWREPLQSLCNCKQEECTRTIAQMLLLADYCHAVMDSMHVS